MERPPADSDINQNQNPNPNSRPRSATKYPPGPYSMLPTTLLFKFINDPINLLSDCVQKYGDICHFKFGRQHIYLLNHPDLIKDVLVTNNHKFVKSRGTQIIKKVVGEGLLTSEGKIHSMQRKAIQPVFNPDRIKAYVDIMANLGLQTSYRWKDGSEFDIHREMMQLTLAIVSKTLFGSDIEEQKAGQVADAVRVLVEYFNRLRSPFGELFEKLPLPSNRRVQRSKKVLDDIIYKMISQRRNEPGMDGRVDLLSMLLGIMQRQSASGETEYEMDDQQVRDQAMTLFLAGHETMANALTWTFYMLSQNPAIERKLLQELEAVVGNVAADESILPSVSHIPKLTYTETVFRESMRLYPPAWALGRKTLQDYEAAGYTIPAGSVVIMSQYLMHRDRRYYDQPDSFVPERWLSEGIARLPRFSYFPFGGGPRSCIGEPFAWTEGILMIAIIAHRWKIRLVPGHNVALLPAVTLRPKYGVLVKAERRN